MSTSVSLFVLASGSEQMMTPPAAPPDVLDVVAGSGQPVTYAAGRIRPPPSPYIFQFRLTGLDKCGTGRRLMGDLQRIGYDARLHVRHQSPRSSASGYWPDAPDWLSARSMSR